MTNLSSQIRSAARELGFARIGICEASEPPGLTRFHEWLDRGYAGCMDYLANRSGAYESPDAVLAGARSLIVLAMDYRTVEPGSAEAGQGRVSRYAWGEVDYHDLIHRRLKELGGRVLELRPDAKVRGVVDTAPLLEREYAQLAGLGWVGKNTLLIDREAGSWFFLAVLLTDLELDCDEPHRTDHCGTCRACLDACPTDAFPQPYVLDATRCISYLTIELRALIPESLRAGVGDWVFGCDICQEVCPWNNHSAASSETDFQPRDDLNPLELADLFSLDDEGFRARFRRTPLWRAKRRGLLRNAAIVLGNQRDERATAALVRGLNDDEPLVRAASAWALRQIDSAAARKAVQQRARDETDPLALEEML